MTSFSTPPSKISLGFEAGLTSTAQLLTTENTSQWTASYAAKPAQAADVITALSYNVWFSTRDQVQRHSNLINEIHSLKPTVCILQEVKPLLADSIRAAMGQYYHISKYNYFYGNLTLVSKDVTDSCSFSEVELTSLMGRYGLLASFKTKADKAVVVGNVHLESLNNASARAQQMIEIRDAMSYYAVQSDLMLVGGDFNFDDLQTWGDWRKNEKKSLFFDDGGDDNGEQRDESPPPTPLENANVEKILYPTYSDCWLALDKDSQSPPPVRFTFDGATNPYPEDEVEQMRYDRILVHKTAGLSALREIEVVRREEVSDHYGLMATFQLR
jgi:endonuclease/exonuclease/phosphatase family metal-dependent hydrolase